MSDPGYPKVVHKKLFFQGGWFTPEGGSYAEYNYTQDFDSRSDDRISVKTPGWPHNIRDNPYYRSYWTRDCSPFNWSGRENPPGVNTGSGTNGSFIYDPQPPETLQNVEDMRDEVRSRVLMKLQSEIKNQNFNAGVALAEARRTSQLVGSTAIQIANAFRSLKKGRIKQAIRGLTGSQPSHSSVSRVERAGAVPQKWLELQYGWRPLLSDVYGACESLRDAYAEKPPFLSAKVRVGQSLNLSGRFTAQFKSLDSKFTQKASCRAQGFIEYQVGNAMMAYNSQTGIQNPLSVAWEIVPYSFVVDWFLPVGTFLNNLDYASGLEFRRGYISRRMDNNVTMRLADSGHDEGNAFISHSGGTCTITGMIFDREVLGQFPEVQFPSLKNPLSLTHVANGLSLLATAFGRR